ncbi:ECF transporter S component [Caldinitratiruptor microaerophilus]|uniref:Membrane protein n=1 Tax=Caldinitratiruptor microaerophilus TaxID=671077 RepID=A0AA35CMY0_9FIRM|nr:ECF transporter S component [Caldinitratiruptor microaerophilus]BDG62092.1 membrane protein [Caldinitratiruptor microaerophilus]
MKPRDVGLAILLTALALVIPLAFTFLRVVIPPFTATLASHVPSMLAVFISPAVAVLVGVGSTLGFLVATGPVVAARAATHIVWGYMSAVLYRRGWPAWAALLAAVVPHALGEALVVVPFGYDLYRAGVVVGVGTLLHHLVDMGITLAVVALLRQARIPLTDGRP